MRNTFSYQFYCRPSKANKKGLAHVELGITVNGTRLFINLPYRCNPSDFNKKKRPKEIEEYLSAQRLVLQKVLTDLAENNLPVTSENLRNYYRTGGVKSYTVEDLFNEYLTILKQRVGKTLTQGVYRKYELVRDLFYEGFDPKQEVSAITNSVVRHYFAVLDGKYDNSTSVGYKTKFKAIIVFGMDNNKIKINPFQGIKITKEKKPIDYLTEEEIRLLVETPIENESLSRVRDAAVFQLASGLSFADVAALRPEDIQEEGGVFFVAKNRVKTGTPFCAPILCEGVEVLMRNNGQPPKVISNQKYNLYLKSLQTICGIKTNLHSHIFRHTYCTRLLNKRVSIKTISKAAGHANSKVTEYFYAHLEDKTVLNEVAAAFA